MLHIFWENFGIDILLLNFSRAVFKCYIRPESVAGEYVHKEVTRFVYS